MNLVVPVNTPPTAVHKTRVCRAPAGILQEDAPRNTDGNTLPAQTRKRSEQGVSGRMTAPPPHQGGVPAVNKLGKHHHITSPERTGNDPPHNPAAITRERNPEKSP